MPPPFSAFGSVALVGSRYMDYRNSHGPCLVPRIDSDRVVTQRRRHPHLQQRRAVGIGVELAVDIDSPFADCSTLAIGVRIQISVWA